MITSLQIGGGGRIDGQPACKTMIASQIRSIDNHGGTFESARSALTRSCIGCWGEIVALPFRYSTINLLFPRWDHTVGGSPDTQRSMQTITGSTLKMPYHSQGAERPGEKVCI